MSRCLRWLAFMAIVTCTISATAEALHEQRAGLVARAGVDGLPAIPQRTPPPGVGVEPAKRHLLSKRAKPEVLDVDEEEEVVEDSISDTPSNTPSSTAAEKDSGSPKASSAESSKDSLESLEATPSKTPKEDPKETSGIEVEKAHQHDAPQKDKSAAGAGPTATPTSLDLDQPMNGRPAKSGSMAAPLHYDPGEEAAEDLEDLPCDDEPFTVYVTVTVTPDGSKAEPTANNAGGDEDDCTDGCYTATDEEPKPEPTPAPVPVSIPADEEEEDVDDYASSEVEDEWVSSEIDMSASASATGDAALDDDFAGAYSRFRAVPVAVSLALCAMTSLAAGLLFMGP